jgi:undecaprenyl-diphosphatase
MFYYLTSSINLRWDQIFNAISTSSDPVFQILISLLIFVILYLLSYKLEAIFYVFNIGFTGASNLILKNTVKRIRPIGIKLTEAHGYSFPSGHTSISTAIGIILIYFILKRVKNKKTAYIISGFIIAYLIIVGISRIYLGVHYPTDIYGGWLLAGIWSYITILAYKFCLRKGVNKFLDKYFTIKFNIFKDKSKPI